jgi:hypothetical protein
MAGMDEQAPNRRWFQFSLRTLFVVATVICVWLGWNVSTVQSRKRALARIQSSEGRFIVNTGPDLEQQGNPLPYVRQLLGDKPIAVIAFRRGRILNDECHRIASLFPEAVRMGYSTGGPNPTEPLD